MFFLLVHKKAQETVPNHAKLPLEKFIPAEELKDELHKFITSSIYMK